MTRVNARGPWIRGPGEEGCSSADRRPNRWRDPSSELAIAIERDPRRAGARRHRGRDHGPFDADAPRTPPATTVTCQCNHVRQGRHWSRRKTVHRRWERVVLPAPGRHVGTRNSLTTSMPALGDDRALDELPRRVSGHVPHRLSGEPIADVRSRDAGFGHHGHPESANHFRDQPHSAISRAMRRTARARGRSRSAGRTAC